MPPAPLLSDLRTTLADTDPYPAAPAPVRHVARELSDPDQFGAAVSGVELRADFLRRSASVTRVEQFQSPGWALDFYDAQVKARILGRSLTGWGSIALMTSEAPSRFYGQPAARGALVFTPPGAPIDGCIAPGFRSIALHVAPAAWERCRRLAAPDAQSSGSSAFEQGTVRRLAARALDAFERRLLALRRQLVTGDRSARAAAAEVAGGALATELLTAAWELQLAGEDGAARGGRRLRNRTRIARRAEDWLRAHLREPLAIPDLCLALQVSRRELEYAFRETFDQSPREFLAALRLNAIHRALRTSPPDRSPVTRLALEHGVTHLGRFAAQYRQLFGVLPSARSGR